MAPAVLPGMKPVLTEPANFIIGFPDQEARALMSQFATSSRGGTRKRPHASGRSKALFLHNLGFRLDQPDVLRRALLQHAADNAVGSTQQTSFGAKYLIEGRISGPTRTAAMIRSVWFVESGERSPRFITAYPLRGVQK